ncbi:MAG: cell division protein SepF [Lachnospiraceae bacterium]|nr:cell division protein SepF [Lachnospiraceae bacterium]
MGVIDKLLDIVKLSPDDDEDDFFEDEVEAQLEKETAKIEKEERRRDRVARSAAPAYEPEEEPEPEPEHKVSFFRDREKKSTQTIPGRNGRNMEVVLIRPSTVEDAREISDTLINGRAVVINLEGLHLELAQRIIDFTSGACYSIRGNLQKISNYIFIVTPQNIELSGDFQEYFAGNSAMNISKLDLSL